MELLHNETETLIHEGDGDFIDDYELWGDDRVDEHERLGADNRVDEGTYGDDVYENTDDDEVHDGLTDDDINENDEEYLEARKKLRESKREEIDRLLQEAPDVREEDEPLSEYEDSDGDINSEDDSDSDDDLYHKSGWKKVVYDPRCDHKSMELTLGMRFEDGLQCRKALTTYSIENAKFVQFRRVSKEQCEARCFLPCPWQVYASVVKKDLSFCIKRYDGDHQNCPRHMSNKLLTSRWIALRYINVFRVRPCWSIPDLRQDIVDRFRYDIPKDRLYKARKIANNLVRGTVDHQYGLIRRYVAELRNSDKDGRFELLLGDDHVFKGLYVGFSSLIKGFKVSCRPIIGLDDTHLRTYIRGILLCATWKDGNNQMFPIAWAVVETENGECWSWFMKCLIENLSIGDGNGYTFMSDQQKGLENAVRDLAPYAEHRNCSRHVYMNWAKHHKGATLKNLFSKVTRSTYPEKFKRWLMVMKKESVDAYQDFINRDFKKFCKAFISSSCYSDMIDNNISETFNGYITSARGKHIIDMFEEIRSNLMLRQVKKRADMMKVNDRICPNVRKKLEELRYQVGECQAIPNLNNHFEVTHYENRFVVHVNERKCSCRVWDTTGIPCVHAVAALHFMGIDPVNYVHEYYTVERYLKAYEYGLEPMRGENQWPEVEGFIVKPPPAKKMRGRPKKKRIRSIVEKEQGNPKKMSRRGMVMKCTNCGQDGHNKRKCKNAPVERQEKSKGKRGRPAKQPCAESQPTTRTTTAAQTTTRSTTCTVAGRGGARGGGRGVGFQVPRATSGSIQHLARERNFARRGVGVFVGEGTGNIYYAAGQRTIHTIHHTTRVNDSTSTSAVNQRATSTQESRNNSAPN